jgi:ribonuclease Z
MLDVCLRERWDDAAAGQMAHILLIRYNGRMILIDWGEGTQIPLKMAEWGFKAIDAVCLPTITQICSRIAGFLLTLGNSGRTEPLTMIGPPGLKKVVGGLTVISPELPYELQIVELPDSESAETCISDIYIKSIPVDHTLTCLSYCIEIKRQGKFEVERANKLMIPVNYWSRLQKGETITLEDRVITPEMVLGAPRKGIKICYCTDTRPTEELAGFINGSDLFICEGMYGDAEDSSKAVQKKHMMFSEAALLAKQGNVGELWLTHYSPSLTDPEEYIEAARTIFRDTVAGKDLLAKTIKY